MTEPDPAELPPLNEETPSLGDDFEAVDNVTADGMLSPEEFVTLNE